VKSHVIANPDTGLIYDVDEAKGTVHDFTLCKETLIPILMFCVMLKLLADSGYQGIENFHANSEIPIKKPRGGELLPLEKAYNKSLSRRRVFIEHINCKIKVWKIMSDRYRNRPQRHFLRTKLLCGIINYEKKNSVLS
jgi:hypothetical protein